MATALSLLRTRPRFRALWLAIALSYTGTGAALTALTLYVQERQGTGVAVGAVALAFGLPRIVGPLTGVLADRVELRRAMVLCDLGQAACFAALAALPPFGPILGLVVLTTLLQTIYGPARTAAIPALVEDGELLAANASLGVAYNLNAAIGPLLGGIVFALIGPSAVLWINAASFVFSALLTTRLSRIEPRHGEEADVPEAVLASLRAGARFVLADSLTRVLLLSLLFAIGFVAIDQVALVFLVRETLGGSAAAYGVVCAVYGVGTIAGSVGVLARLHAPAPRVYLAGLLLTALGTLLTGLAPLVAVVALTQAVAGGGDGAALTGMDTIIQRYVPRQLVGRVFGFLLAAISLGTGLASLLGGVLVDATSPRAALLIAGAGALLVAALAAPVLRRDHEP